MEYGAQYVVDMLCERGTEFVKAVQGFSHWCLLRELGWGMVKQKGGFVCSGQIVEGFDFWRVDKRVKKAHWRMRVRGSAHGFWIDGLGVEDIGPQIGLR